MILIIERLHFLITFLPSIVESFVFLIGALLVLIPTYQLLISTDKPTCRKVWKVYMEIYLGITRPLAETPVLETFAIPTSTTWRQAASHSVVGVTSDSIVSEVIDTEVCFMPENSTSMVAGLVNTGNSCFLNSVLQSLSSLPKLQAYLNQVSSNYSKSRSLPVTRSLLKTLRLLSTPTNNAFRPNDIVNALASNHRVINREQQDAQELYQLLISELEDEKRNQKCKQGFRDLLPFATYGQNNMNLTENPLNGLLAYRIVCTKCEYSSGIPLQTFNNVQLTLPNTDSTTLDDCFKQLTSMEVLEDVECSKCSLVNTLQEIQLLIQQSSKVEKLACLQKFKQEIEHRLQEGRIEQEYNDDVYLKGLLKKSVVSKTKQSMFAKPPKVLCLHFVRSIYSLTGEMSKNPCQVEFPQILDLSKYCTDGTLSTQSNSPISTPNTSSATKYRLMSIIVHYGDHYSGHYIAYKRRVYVEKCHCGRCGQQGDIKLKPHDSEWFRISDDNVTLCHAQDALEENPFMLMYELIEDEDDNISLISSETTVINRTGLKRPTAVDSAFLQEEDDVDLYLSSNLPAAPPSSPLLSPLLSSVQYTKPKRNNVNNKGIRRLNLRNPPPIAILSQ